MGKYIDIFCDMERFIIICVISNNFLFVKPTSVIVTTKQKYIIKAYKVISREDAVADLFSLLKKAGYAILIPIKSIACVRI